MSDSVKQKNYPLPPALSGGAFHMQGISYYKDLLYMLSCELFLKVQDVQWICCKIRMKRVFVENTRKLFD